MLQNQVAELLNTFAALKAGTNQPTASATCPNLVRNISRHSRGADVTSLQKFLIAQGLLTADSATGLFGSLTERAIQQWQKKAGIISAGSPGTTGYGAVGPKTRAALLKCH